MPQITIEVKIKISVEGPFYVESIPRPDLATWLNSFPSGGISVKRRSRQSREVQQIVDWSLLWSDDVIVDMLIQAHLLYKEWIASEIRTTNEIAADMHAQFLKEQAMQDAADYQQFLNTRNYQVSREFNQFIPRNLFQQIAHPIRPYSVRRSTLTFISQRIR